MVIIFTLYINLLLSMSFMNPVYDDGEYCDTIFLCLYIYINEYIII